MGGPFDARGLLEPNGQRPATGRGAFVQRDEQRGLKETKPQDKIGVKRRRERVALIEGLVNAATGLVQLGVVHGHAHESSRTQPERPFKDRGEQSLRLPVHARAQEILGRPVALLPAIGPDDPRQRPAPQTHQGPDEKQAPEDASGKRNATKHGKNWKARKENVQTPGTRGCNPLSHRSAEPQPLGKE